MNASFWIYWRGSWVKICLTRERPRIDLYESYSTEEGFCQHSETYERTSKGVIRISESYEKDCDGPLERFDESFCPFKHLQAPYEALPEYPDMPDERPVWTRVTAGQRDYYAEMAGY